MAHTWREDFGKIVATLSPEQKLLPCRESLAERERQMGYAEDRGADQIKSMNRISTNQSNRIKTQPKSFIWVQPC